MFLFFGSKEWREVNGKVHQIHVDGNAIGSSWENLFCHALNAWTFIRFATLYLKDPSLMEAELVGHAERLGDTEAVDGMLMDNNLYLTTLERNAIMCYRPIAAPLTQ